jgi:glycosyltransferase involved in cell wall biosynthesis
MNVLLVVPWDQEFGGVASVVGNVTKYLGKAGHHVVLLHPGGRNRLQRRTTAWGFSGYALNLRAPFVPARPIRSLVAFLAFFFVALYELRRLIRLHGIQVVNVHYPIEGYVHLGVLRWLLPIKLVISVHGADIFPDGQKRKRYPWPLRFLVFSADALVAPSRAFLGDCLLAFPKAAGKGLFIHNGVDIGELAQAELETTPAESRPYLLCIAANNHKKALDVLLNAFARIAEAYRPLRLVLVGDGPLRHHHEELARSLRLHERVAFLGGRGRAEVARLLRECEIFVLPSRSEPFGVVIAEALACQKAVVASAVGGIPEIIEDGRTGILVEPDRPAALAGAVLALLQDVPRRESLAQAGYRRVVEHFSCEKMGAGYESLYAALVDGHRAP